MIFRVIYPSTEICQSHNDKEIHCMVNMRYTGDIMVPAMSIFFKTSSPYIFCILIRLYHKAYERCLDACNVIPFYK